MYTYTCERPNIIQIALKGLPGGERAVKTLSDLEHHHQPINIPTVGAQAFLMEEWAIGWAMRDLEHFVDEYIHTYIHTTHALSPKG
jgi:hypothetical protein